MSSGDAAASAAASLGWANQKSPEPWRPDKATSASAAAALAKDSTAPAVRDIPTAPAAASTGASKAALLAVGSASAALKASPPTPEKKEKSNKHQKWGSSAATQAFNANRPASVESATLAPGSSAATQAFQNNRNSVVRTPEPPVTPSRGDRSLAAAKGAMSSSKKAHAPASPGSQSLENRRLEEAAASSALNGAALAHRNSLMAKTPIEETGAVPVTTMTRNMFTSHPPVKPEVDEKTNTDRLHQTAVEMARKMYSQQQKAMEQAKENQGEDSTTPYAGSYLNLQDAAFKQAHERLAKLHDEHQQGREFQEYYGNTTSTSPRRKFSIANKLRRHTSIDSDDLEDDRERSNKIREQMSMFSSKLSQVDKEKRDKDREALLAAAQRNVKARLQGMDEKASLQTGKRNSTRLTDFELKAQQAAQARHETRGETKGKINIGGGKFMDADEINAIAAKKMQPLLDDINEKAETERARLEALKQAEDARKEELERQKARERQEKDEIRKQKEQEKHAERMKKQQAKEEEHARKEQEKAKKNQEKQEEKARKEAAKEEKRKSKMFAHTPATVTSTPAVEHNEPHEAEEEDDEHTAETTTVGESIAHTEGAESGRQMSVDSTPKSKSKVTRWLSKRFSRTISVSEKEGNEKRRSIFGSPKTTNTAAVVTPETEEVHPMAKAEVPVAHNEDEDDDETEDDFSPALETPVLDTDVNHAATVDHETDSRGVSPITPAQEADKKLEAPAGTEHETHEADGDKDTEEVEEHGLEPPKTDEAVGRSSFSSSRRSHFKEEV